jgi:hypothetical protein
VASLFFNYFSAESPSPLSPPPYGRYCWHGRDRIYSALPVGIEFRVMRGASPLLWPFRSGLTSRHPLSASEEVAFVASLFFNYFSAESPSPLSPPPSGRYCWHGRDRIYSALPVGIEFRVMRGASPLLWPFRSGLTSRHPLSASVAYLEFAGVWQAPPLLQPFSVPALPRLGGRPGVGNKRMNLGAGENAFCPRFCSAPASEFSSSLAWWTDHLLMMTPTLND